MALSTLPYLANAAQCRAVYYLTSNTAGGGIGGGAMTGTNGIDVYGADGGMIGSYVPRDIDDPIC